MANESPIAIIYGSDGVGGYEEKGTASKPLRVDPTGTTPQPVSATALPLPTGAATEAKQPAFGTAGTPSADVVSVQGVGGGTPVPVGGTVTANQGTAGGSPWPVSGTMTADQGTPGASPWPVTNSANGATGAPPPADATLVGLDDGTNLVAMQADAFGRAKVASGGDGTGGYYPDYYDNQPGPGNHEPGTQTYDNAGNAKARAAVVTDEGSIRDDFPGSSLDTSLAGTALFTNGSYDVVGTGTSFLTDLSRYYMVRRTGDNASYAVRISDVVDDTHLVLSEPYAGTTGTSAPIKSVWSTIIGAGGSVAVNSSVLTIGSGTSSGSNSFAHRLVDYGPMVCSFYASISQRIANQEGYLGLIDSGSVSQQARIIFDGTDNTKLKLRTGNGANPTDIETSVATSLPNGATTATTHWYRVELSADAVTVYVDGTFCVQNKVHLPNFYASLGMAMGIENTGVPSSSTDLLVDVATTTNFNMIQIGGGAVSSPSPTIAGGIDTAGTYRTFTVKDSNPNPAVDRGIISRPIPFKTSVTAVSAVTSSASSVTILAANVNRIGAMVFNRSTQILYLKLSSTAASATSFTARLPANAYYEVPFGYTGEITGIWASANGDAQVTEITP